MVILSELLEGSSSSSSTRDHSYDVFLSFRGLDTRDGFTKHLYEALIDANVTTFLDDEEIETGEELNPKLKSAIKASRASIIVLSKNYAFSRWCLDELVLILEQRMTSNHIVIPIFYHVEPTHVRKQQSSFGDAMVQHRQKMEEDSNDTKRSDWVEKIDRWNEALTKVADLKGREVDGRLLDTEFIEEIVKEICSRLHVPLMSAQQQLFGMNDSINFISSWLKDGSLHTADILTILGIGGIGKTSLARYVYGLHSHEFHTSSYIEDISRKCDGKFNGLLDLQKQLCGDILKSKSVQVQDVKGYTLKVENAVARKTVLLVLDDIDNIDQLNALLGSKGFHPGSKIIITTKNKWLTESCALFKTNIKPKHAKHLLQGLDIYESRKLLCFHAFGCNQLKAGYKEVLDKLVEYCQGHPLALEVLGESLHNRDVAYWEGCIEGLKKEPGSRINNVLRRSFDSLPSNNDKELFKHIACFFVGIDRDVTITILEACDINTRSGITNLIDRFLLRIGWNNDLKMHQLVQEMGRFEVRQESLDKPWKRSRSWCHKESFRVLKQKKGKENLVGLALDMRMLEKENVGASFKVKTDALSDMNNLMLLQLNYVHMNGSYENFPEELRWLCMHGCNLQSIPLDLPMENLVALDMSHSNIELFLNCYSNTQQHEKRQKLDRPCLKYKRLLRSLKVLNLSFCKQLRGLGDFDQFPALERLIVKNCTHLVEVCESIQQCAQLVLIDLSNCKKLEKLPRTIGMLKNVKEMLLDGCNLGKSRTQIRDMDSLEMCKSNNIGITTRASSSASVGSITSDLMFILPSSLVRLSLSKNNLSTQSFPMDFSCLSMLKELYLDENPIVSMPSCVRTIPRLEILTMKSCIELKSIEHPPHTLIELWSNCDDIEKVVFNPKMSPLMIRLTWMGYYKRMCYEVEGIIKIQPIVDVEEKVLRRLGWIELDFLNDQHKGNASRESKIQMFYEYGIFSIVYEQERDEMPSWLRYRSVGSSISFTIPSSTHNLRGLNFCSVQMLRHLQFPNPKNYCVPEIAIWVKNITKNSTWEYRRHINQSRVVVKFSLILSHWMFGMNELEAGDHVTVIVEVNTPLDADIKECGVSLLYDDDDGDNNMDDEEEDVLAYYKSWNHIIGGDLSPFHLTTGQYYLHHSRFLQHGRC